MENFKIKIGDRLLVQRVGAHDIYEVFIEEISPDKNFCKVAWAFGSYEWLELDGNGGFLNYHVRSILDQRIESEASK